MGCAIPAQNVPEPSGTGWVLVENPRYGTRDAKPDERQYVWVREDRAANLTVAPQNVVRDHLRTAPGQLSGAHSLALPALSLLKVEAPQGGTVNPADVEVCRVEAATKVPTAKLDALETTAFALSALAISPLGLLNSAAVAQQKLEMARIEAARMALERYRLCLVVRGYRVDGISQAETDRAVPSQPDADCPSGLVKSRGGAWCVVEEASR
jgi:hypothetical protein